MGRVGYMIVGAAPEHVMAVGNALEAKLATVGWTRVNAPPPTAGHPAGTQMQRGPWVFDLRSRLAEVAMQTASPEQWQEACRVAAIDAVQIDLPQLQSGPTGAATGTPASGSGTGRWDQKARGGILLTVLAALFIAVVLPLVRSYDGKVVAQSSSSSTATSADTSNHISADGKSNLPGGYATASYSPSGYDWETTHGPTNKDGVYDGAEWWLGQYLPKSMLHFGIDHRVWEPTIETRQDELEFVRLATGYASQKADGAVKTGHTKIGGRAAHTWRYTTKDGKWIYESRVLGPVHSYRFVCVNDHPTAENLDVTESRCDAFLSSVKYHEPH